MASMRGGLIVKKKISAVSIAIIQKASLQTFLRQGLIAVNK